MKNTILTFIVLSISAASAFAFPDLRCHRHYIQEYLGRQAAASFHSDQVYLKKIQFNGMNCYCGFCEMTESFIFIKEVHGNFVCTIIRDYEPCEQSSQHTVHDGTMHWFDFTDGPVTGRLSVFFLGEIVADWHTWLPELNTEC